MKPAATARRVDFAAVAPGRARYLAGIDAQVRYDAVHQRCWGDYHALSLDRADVGYAAIKGYQSPRDRDALFEVSLDPQARPHAVPLAGPRSRRPARPMSSARPTTR